jgi:lauroyl/myristoyl acyltransferase
MGAVPRSNARCGSPCLASSKLTRSLRRRLLGAALVPARSLPHGVLRVTIEQLLRIAGGTAPARRVRSNLALAAEDLKLDPATLRDLPARIRSITARQIADGVRLSRPDAGAWIDEIVEPGEGYERIAETLEQTPGTIILGGHMGNWELLAIYLVRRGVRGVVVGRGRGEQDWLAEMRSKHGVETLPQDASARETLRILRSGRILGVLSDLEARQLDGTFVPFLGQPALTMTAPAAIARAARAPLLPVRCVFNPQRKRYQVLVDPPLWSNPELDSKAATLDLLLRMNRVYESWIRANPEQWAWHQRRWWTKPGSFEAIPNPAFRRDKRARNI